MKITCHRLNDLSEFSKQILMPVVVFHADLRLYFRKIDDQRAKRFVGFLSVQSLTRFPRARSSSLDYCAEIIHILDILEAFEP